MNNTYKMKEIYDVVAIGEYLIDFSPNGTGLTNNPQYEMNPGGAPTNCLAACARLGGKSAIILLRLHFMLTSIHENWVLQQNKCTFQEIVREYKGTY